MPSPEFQSLLEMFKDNNPLLGDTVLEMRANMDAATANAVPPPDTQIRRLSANGVAAEQITANSVNSEHALLYFHGGGYCMGGLDSHRGLCSAISHASDITVFNIDYRLAPEHPFPAAIDDCLAAYRYVLDQGFGASNIAFAGDSAGGGLVVATLLSLKAQGLAMPAAGVCISPWVDLSQTATTMTTLAKIDPMVSAAILNDMATAYLNGVDPGNTLASPVNGELDGLPPLLIQVGSAEVLLDDARTLAARASAAGVSVSLREWTDMIHVWHSFVDFVPESQQAITELAEYLHTQL